MSDPFQGIFAQPGKKPKVPKPKPKDPFGGVLTPATPQTQAPTTPTVPGSDPFAQVARPANAPTPSGIDDLIRAGQDASSAPVLTDPSLRAAAAGLEATPWAVRHPIMGTIVNTIRDVGQSIGFSLGAHPTKNELNNPYLRALVRSRLGPLAMAKLDQQAQAAPDSLDPVYKGQVMRGTAMIASLPVAEVVGPLIKVPPTLVGRVGKYLVGEAAGGGIYGSLRPTADGETRTEAVLNDAGSFMIVGGVFHGVASGAGFVLRRYVLGLPPVTRDQIVTTARRILDQNNDVLARNGDRLGSLPIEDQQATYNQALEAAIEIHDPNAVHLEDNVRKIADQIANEPNARFGEERPELSVSAAPGERALDLPEPPFEIEPTQPFKVPPKVEPAPAPKGFIEGAGQPAREIPRTTVTDVHGRPLRVYRGTVHTPAGPFYAELPEHANFFATKQIGGYEGYTLPSGRDALPKSRIIPAYIRASKVLDLTQPVDKATAESVVKAMGLYGDEGGSEIQRAEREVLRTELITDLTQGNAFLGPRASALEDRIPQGYDAVKFRDLNLGDPHGIAFLVRDQGQIIPAFSREAEELQGTGGRMLSSAVSLGEDGSVRVSGFMKGVGNVPGRGPEIHGMEIGTIVPDISSAAGDATARVSAVFKRPLILDSWDNVEDVINSAREKGYDGIIVTHGAGTGESEFVALDPDNIQYKPLPYMNEYVQGMSHESLLVNYDNGVRFWTRNGASPNEAASLAARDMANNGVIRPDQIGDVEVAFRRLNQLFGDDVARPISGRATVQSALEEMSLANTTPEVAGQVTKEYIEPREVTPIEGAPKGFQPTQIGEAAPKAASRIAQLAVLDQAIRETTARIDMLRSATPEVRSDATLLFEHMEDPGLISTDQTGVVKAALDKALEKEGPAADQGLLLDLTYPQPWEVDLDRKITPEDAKYVHNKLNKALNREVAPIEIEPHSQVKAPWRYSDVDNHPATPSMDGLEILARLNDDQLEQLNRQLMQQALHPKSSIAGFAAPRLLIGLTGAGFEAASFNDNLSDGQKNVLRVVGGFMMAASMHPTIAEWFKTSKFTRNFLLNANPKLLMSARDAESFTKYVNATTYAKTLALTHSRAVEKLFPDEAVRRTAAISLDEMDPVKGYFPPEFYTLTKSQQQALMGLNQFNYQLGQVLQNEGILDTFKENYIRHLMPSETYQSWKVNGYRVMGTGGPFTKPRHIDTIRELEQYAATHNLPGPVTDVSKLQGFHILEAYRAINNVRLVKELENTGILQAAPASAYTALPPGFRVVRISGYGNKMAPEPVAKALENIATSSAGDNEFLNSLDTIKGYWMRATMFWFWEHGLNAMRMMPLISMNPKAFGEAWTAVKRLDPVLLDAAKNGLNLFNRPDFIGETSKSFEKVMQVINSSATLRSITAAGGKLIEKQDRILWDHIVPSMQLFAYSTQMKRWAEETGGKFLPGSTEYTVAARRAAAFANTAMGKIPTELSNPRFQQWMRLVLFSPQWTTSRMALTANAAGELSAIAEGSINPKHTAYLPMKLRQVAWLAGITWLGSKLLSGQEPQFNPNTQKFYMLTGLKTPEGRDLGLDLAGWWQDDLKLFNAPNQFLAGRLNPMIKVAGQTITGRDYLGRDMTPIQSMANIVRSFGPFGAATELGARGVRSLASGEPIEPGEVAQLLTRTAAMGNVSALPSPIDVTIGKLSQQILRRQGIPQNDYITFELSRLLRGNLIAGHQLIDNRVITYLAYRRRSLSTKEPLGTGGDWLWAQARNAMADF